MFKINFPLFKKKERKPAESGNLVTLSGAVMLFTPDGNNVVLTPELARLFAENMPHAATEAERFSVNKPAL